MDIYVLDENLQPAVVVDTYESAIWTERYSEWGDFEIVSSVTDALDTVFRRGTPLGLPGSKRIMIVETVEEPGDGMQKFTGRSMEAILDSRVNQPTNISAGNASAVVTRTGTPQSVAKFFFESTCRTNSLVAADNLPFVEAGDLFPAGNIPMPTDSLTYQYAEESLYSAIKGVCDPYELGFVIGRNHGSAKARFQVYTGSDRSGWQKTLPPVIFSPELDTLQSASMITSSANHKNVAYVFAQNGSRIVYGNGADPSTAGIDRRVMLVEASDIAIAKGAALDQALEVRGKQALAEHRSLSAFDGEIPPSSPYVYGVDYFLGDFVERRNSTGYANKMLVTEQIFVSDAEGDRSYPTLQALDLITPGSWYAWSRTGVWNDATGTWDSV